MVKTLLVLVALGVPLAIVAIMATDFVEKIPEFQPAELTNECTTAIANLTQTVLDYTNKTMKLPDASNIVASINAINSMEWSCS